jgi:hypothetical protein
MQESFGARLRQQRESRQIDLVAIAAQTKIKVSLLEGLEKDDVSMWPYGIFRRSYIRSYASTIGLDPDEVLREFLEVHPEQVEDFAATAAALEDASPKAPPTRFRTLVDSALDSLVKLTTKPRPSEDAAPKLSTPRPAAPVANRGKAAGAPALLDQFAPDRMAETAAGGEGAALPRLQPGLASDLDPDLELPSELESARGVAQIQPTLAMTLDEEPGPHDAAVTPEPPAADRLAPAMTEEKRAGPVMNEAVPAGDVKSVAAALEQAVTAAVQAAVHTPSLEPALETIARLCTELGRVVDRHDIQRLLNEAARLLNGNGMIVWLWDELTEELRPGLVQGYSDKVLAYLPGVKREDDNATAAAFRTESTCEVAATADNHAALVVPLLIPDGCAGVMAIELQPEVQITNGGRALATLLAAALASLVHRAQPPKRQTAAERTVRSFERHTPATRPVVKVRR